MSQDRDPLLLLPRIVDPDPDPVVMNATIAQSREAFANRHVPQRRATPSWSEKLRQSARFLVPAGLGAAALAIAIVVAPNLMQMPAETDRDLVADRPTAVPAEPPPTLSRGGDEPTQAAPQDEGVRLGMQPPPSQPMPEAQPALPPIFEGDGVRIGTRTVGSEIEFYLPDLAGEPVIDSYVLLAGEDIEILAAFALPQDDIVALRLRVDEARFWRVYRPIDGVYARDPDLSALAADASDQAEVERLLAAQ